MSSILTDRAASIHIVGITQAADLVGDALLALKQADLVIGSQRQLELVQPLFVDGVLVEQTVEPDWLELPKLADLNGLIDSYSNQKGCQFIVVLASGDPLYYGIGRWFSKHYEAARLTFYPAISSIQMACHRSGVALQDVTVLSLHGRPLEKLRTRLKKHSRLLILTDKHSQPKALAQECLAAGFEQSSLTVFENLSYPHERIRKYSAQQLADDEGLGSETFEPLHVTMIEVAGKGGIMPEFPGIPDAAYATGAPEGKGMLTKREVRLCVLSMLQPENQDVIWDLGAGCGGVAVELAYWNEHATVYAVECHAERLQHLATNQRRFGVVSNLRIISGHAPECLSDLPNPTKVFIGGSGTELAGLLRTVWSVLPEEGLLVASAVLEKTRQILTGFAEGLDADQVESVEVSIKRGRLADSGLDYTAKFPVEVFKFIKKGGVQ
ncbi:MAG: precorrin-6y C5,15-methyltransferase (decarboxylating) subunit CbiE [Arenicella sp.]